MKVLLIGGTGTISTAVARLLAERGEDLTLLNRGNRSSDVPAGAKVIICDANDEAAVAEKTAGETYDVVCQFVGYKPEQVQRDYRLFAGRTKQYIFISSAAAYHRPITDYRITEGIFLPFLQKHDGNDARQLSNGVPHRTRGKKASQFRSFGHTNRLRLRL